MRDLNRRVRHHWRSIVLFVLVGLTAFIAFPSALGFDDETHKKITENALTPISFSPSALATINQASKAQNETSGTNLPNLLESSRHFNDNALGAGYDFFRAKAEEALDLARDCYKNEGTLQGARYSFGEGIHALQDFYSRSNWIEKEYAGGSNPIAFRWDLFSPWNWDSGYSRWKRTWTGSLPEGLRTGYMARAEWRVGPVVTQRRSSASEDVGTRAQIVKEFQDQDYQNTQNPRLRRTFPYNSDYKERVRQQANFPKVIEYATQDPTKALLHFDLNKDTPNTMEGSVRTPGGNTLYDVAVDLAATDTQRHWRAHMERLAFEKYGGCAGLIIPAFKGTPIPEIKMRVTIDRNQQARNMPIRGSIAVKVTNLPKPMKKPIRVEVKFYLEPSNDPDSRGGNAKLKVLEFSEEREQSFSLEPFNLMIGDRTGKYDLVAIASYECDPDFKPNKQRVPLDENDLEIKSATCDPNPLCLGETADLTVRYEYDESSGGKVYGEGTIENADRSQIHLINKRELPLTRSGEAMELAPFKETWKPTVAGKYIWRIKLSTKQNEPPKTAEVVINVNTPGEKGVSGNGRINEIEGKIGDNFTLTVNYVVSGAKRNVTFIPSETSQVQQIDGNLESVAPRAPPPQLTSKCEPIKRQTTFVYTATKAGIFEWRYEIEVPGYGKLTDSIRFVVRVDKNLVIDSETVEPAEAAAGSAFRLKVKYHLRGMGASTYQKVVEISDITRTATASFRPAPRNVNSSDPTVSTEHGPYTATKPGDYLWTYDIDAGPFGRDRRAVTFRVLDTTERSIDLLSATVTPVKGPVGTTHTLTVRFKLVGLKPKEKVEVHENDYVEFSKQEAHATVTKIVEEPKVFGMKVAGFVSKYSGKHRWNFIIDADGFRTLYGGVSFDVVEEEVKPQLNARLDFPMLTLAPGETKLCSTYISGYRGNTGDRVEIIYPQVVDNWGSLPGQIQVFPGSFSAEPWSMRGAGDYTKEYAASQSYRARETAPPGVTPVQIIVRQKGAGQVTLTLFVKVVKKGENTMGTEQNTPRLPGTYTNRTRPPGGPQIPDTGEPDIPTTVRTDPSGNPIDESNGPGSNTNGPGSNTNGPGTNGPGSNTNGPGTNGPGSNTNGPGTNGPGSNTNGPGTNGPGSNTNGPGTNGPGSNTNGPGSSSTSPDDSGTPSLSDDEEAVVYELAFVMVSSPHIVNDKKVTDAKGEHTVSWEDDQGSIGTVKATGTITWNFPKQITLRSDGAGKYTTTFDTTQDARFGVSVTKAGEHKDPRTFGIYTATNTLSETTLQGDGNYNPTGSASYRVKVWETPSYDLTTSSTKSKPTKHNEPLVEFTPDYFGFHFDKPAVLPHGIAATPFYVHKPGAKPESAKPGSDSSNSQPNGEQNPDDTEKPKAQLQAKLEHDEITVESGFLPSTRSAIIISGWDRTTSKPIEVLYPGLGFMNSLPNELHVFSGSGRQGPDVMNRGASDNGEYTWIESYDAKMQAKPGTYQVLIIIKQEGAGSVQLLQNIKIVPSRSPSGTLTMLQNRTNQATPAASTTTPSPWGQPITNANSTPPMTHTPYTPPMTHTPPYTPPAPTQPMTHVPTYTQPTPPMTHTQPAPTPTPMPTHTPTQTTPPSEEVDWRCAAGRWHNDDGMVINVTISGNTLSAVCVYSGKDPKFQIYPGDPTFLNAQPTGRTTFATSKGYCYPWIGDNVQPRSAQIRMEGKINATCDRLTLTYWTLKHNSTQWVAGTETMGSADFVRFRGTVPSSTPVSQPPRVNISAPRLTQPGIPTFPTVPTVPTAPTYPNMPAPVPMTHPQPTSTTPPTSTCPPGTTPGEQAHTPPPANKPSGFAGTWYCETFGAITFTEGGGRCRGIFQPGANAKGYFDGYAADGVFNGVYNMDYFGEKMSGKLTIRFREGKSYLFRADWVSSTGKTGYWHGSKAD